MPTLKLVPCKQITSPIIELRFFGEPYKFLIDTGATNSVISLKLFNKFPCTEKHFKEIEQIKIFGSAGERQTFVVPFKLRLLGKITDTVTIGTFLDDWHKAAHSKTTVNGLLGQDIMRQFKRISIDYEVGTIDFVE